MNETVTGPIPPLPQQQTRRILYTSLLASDPEPQTAEELQQIMEWADNTRADYAALMLILDGRIGACVKDGELGFVLLSEDDQARLREVESQ